MERRNLLKGRNLAGVESNNLQATTPAVVLVPKLVNLCNHFFLLALPVFFLMVFSVSKHRNSASVANVHVCLCRCASTRVLLIFFFTV